MSITLAIDENLLREAERATNIHDWSVLVNKGLQMLSQNEHATSAEASHFDFDAVLAAAERLPDLTEAEFEQWGDEMQRPLPSPWTSCD